MSVKTKQQMLKEDWEFFKQRRFIEEQVSPRSGMKPGSPAQHDAAMFPRCAIHLAGLRRTSVHGAQTRHHKLEPVDREGVNVTFLYILIRASRPPVAVLSSLNGGFSFFVPVDKQ